MPAPVITIKIAGTGSANATTNSVSNIDIPEDGELLALIGTLYGAEMVDDSRVTSELSFLSTNQIRVNDARGSIMEISHRMSNLTTSGQTVASTTVSLSLPEGIPLQAGERIHLHTQSSQASVVPTAVYTMYIRLQGRGRRSNKRR